MTGVRTKTIYIFFVGILFWAVTCTVQKAYQSLSKEMQPAYAIDPLFSNNVHQNIKQFVQHCDAKDASIVENVQQAFPFVHAISCEKKASGVTLYAVRSKKPFMRVNDQFVLTRDGNLFSEQLFADDVVDVLPTLRTVSNTTSRIAPEIIACMKRIPSEILKTHTVTWIDAWHVLFDEKKDINFTILCTKNTVLNQEAMRYCERIQDDLAQKGLLGIRQWVADMRFENQIILSSGTGGYRHG